MDPALSVFGFLLGHCWAADLSVADRDTHCFSDMWDGSHVRDRHVVTHDGKAVYEGETIYSFDGTKIVFTYVNSLGGVGGGTAQTLDQQVSFTGSMRAKPGSTPQRIDATWLLLEDGYDVSNAGEKTLHRFRAVR